MQIKKTISVVIPIKGSYPMVLDTINSFLRQTITPKEIIIVGSKNDLLKIKQTTIFRNNKKIRLLNSLEDKNEARNLGIIKSSGDFILYTDDDMVAHSKLIESCLKLINKFDALIIPEHGLNNGSFFSQILCLEKELVMDDPGALTPRLFRKSLFKKEEKPFDKKFGLLDEWGFNIKLKVKKPLISKVNSCFYIKFNQHGFYKELIKKYRMGNWANAILNTNKNEAMKRINPVERGVKFYWKKFHFIKKKPVLFLCLMLLKLSHCLAFYCGYLKSYIIKLNKNSI